MKIDAAVITSDSAEFAGLRGALRHAIRDFDAAMKGVQKHKQRGERARRETRRVLDSLKSA